MILLLEMWSYGQFWTAHGDPHIHIDDEYIVT